MSLLSFSILFDIKGEKVGLYEYFIIEEMSKVSSKNK